jgi:hypothetical protein
VNEIEASRWQVGAIYVALHKSDVGKATRLGLSASEIEKGRICIKADHFSGGPGSRAKEVGNPAWTTTQIKTPPFSRNANTVQHDCRIGG